MTLAIPKISGVAVKKPALTTHPKIRAWMFAWIKGRDLDFLRFLDVPAAIKGRANLLRMAENNFIAEFRVGKSGNYGENIVRERLEEAGCSPVKVTKAIVDGLTPDFITNNSIIEVKTGTLFTSGTAHEKIPWASLKYETTLEVTGKTNIIVMCVGRAEQWAHTEGFLASSTLDPEKYKMRIAFVKFLNENNVFFIGMTELMNMHVSEFSHW